MPQVLLEMMPGWTTRHDVEAEALEQGSIVLHKVRKCDCADAWHPVVVEIRFRRTDRTDDAGRPVFEFMDGGDVDAESDMDGDLPARTNETIQ
jgi:hypothetical protein